ncbi:MAG TPA: hypothetical protein VMS62_08195 [Gemmatimonadales bacterium]|nr:hypothetical protein [Gemmatimonadales bacterium]
MEPRVYAHSQSYRLRERMSDAQIKHGQEIRADLTGIRVTAAVDGWRTPAANADIGAIFFCTMGPIRIREVLTEGDSEPLPREVLLDGLAVPGPGTYDILNAVVHSNGSLLVRADANTQIVPRALSPDLPWV